MTEPINFQVNILQGQDLARQTQTQKDVGTHQQIGAEMDRAKESAEEPETVQETAQDQAGELNRDGSGRGRAFQRKKKEGEAESKEAEDDLSQDPNKGKTVDFLR